MKENLKKLILWLCKELTRILLAPIGIWLIGFISLLLPTVVLWFQQGLMFLTDSHPVPGWVISLLLGILIVAVIILVRQQLRIGILKPRKERVFTWRGLEWYLTPAFWLNYRTLQVTEVADFWLATAIKGPFCKNCKRDVSNTIRERIDGCPNCRSTFNLEPYRDGLLGNTFAASRLRRILYTEAQAAAKRNEI